MITKKNQKAFIQTDKKNPAAFNLKAKQYYSIVVTSEHEKMEKTVYLAPGANVDVDFDFDRQISLNINKPYNIKKGTPARFEALLTNNGKKPVQAQIKLILRGGKCHNLKEFSIEIAPKTTETIQYRIIPDENKPLFLRIQEINNPALFDELLIYPESPETAVIPCEPISQKEIYFNNKESMEIKQKEYLKEKPIILDVPGSSNRIEVRLFWNKKGLMVFSKTPSEAQTLLLEVMISPVPGEFIQNNTEYLHHLFPLKPGANQRFHLSWCHLNPHNMLNNRIGINLGLRKSKPDGSFKAISDWHLKPVQNVFENGVFRIGAATLETPVDILGTSGRVSASSASGVHSQARHGWDGQMNTSWKPEMGDKRPEAVLNINEEKHLSAAAIYASDPIEAQLSTSMDGKNWNNPIEILIKDANDSLFKLQEPESFKWLKLTITNRKPETEIFDIELFDTEKHPADFHNPIKVKTAASSSSQGTNFIPMNAFDGKTSTRYSSNFNDGEWLQADIGNLWELKKLRLMWEKAFAQGYRIQVSEDGLNWQTVYEQKNGNGQTEWIHLKPVKSRFIRIVFDKRATGWGSSLWEVNLFGKPLG